MQSIHALKVIIMLTRLYLLTNTSRFQSGGTSAVIDISIRCRNAGYFSRQYYTRNEERTRAFKTWNSTERFNDSDFDVYDIPWLRCVTDLPFMKFCPISPAFRREKRGVESHDANIDETQN